MSEARRYKDARRWKVEDGKVVEVFNDLTMDQVTERFEHAFNREDWEYCKLLKDEAKSRGYNLVNPKHRSNANGTLHKV
jgi:hypothetical protein